MAGELSPQQVDFLRYYTDPKSGTFSNATQSAIKAGYSQDYADNLTSLMPDWLSENIGRRKRLLAKAENNLEILLDSEDERVKADMTKFVAKTLGKENYSERTEMTGKDGKDLIPKPIMDLSDVQPNNSNQENISIEAED
jgi:phage terminase small subunit